MIADCTMGDHEKKKKTKIIGRRNRRFESPPPRYQVSGEGGTRWRVGMAGGGISGGAGRCWSVEVIFGLAVRFGRFVSLRSLNDRSRQAVVRSLSEGRRLETKRPEPAASFLLAVELLLRGGL